ncbi:MAG: aldo/keto reductase [Chloroflexota bacterium]
MVKMRLGKTDLMVSRIGFGGIPIQRCSEETAIAIVRRCLDHGINFIDTAAAYTNSEERIGKAITDRRDGLIIATKSTERTREGIEAHLYQSLKRLNISFIDLYQFHGVNDLTNLNKVLAPIGPMAVLKDAQKRALVRHIGITCHNKDTAKEAVKSGQFETVMFPFNFMTPEPALEVMPLAKERGMGFIAMKPLEGGILSNAALSFKYLLQYPNVLPIVGIEHPHEIDEIMEVVHGNHHLATTDMDEIERMRREMGNQFCRRCDYCQPCEQGIRISAVLPMRGLMKRLPRERLFTGMAREIMSKAAMCTACGQCEERCPYQLPIRNLLGDAVAWYESERAKFETETASEARLNRTTTRPSIKTLK